MFCSAPHPAEDAADKPSFSQSNDSESHQGCRGIPAVLFFLSRAHCLDQFTLPAFV